MPATFSEPAKFTDTVKSVPSFGVHASTMQSEGQLSMSSVLPSSQVSAPDTLLLPHAGSVQLASQPTMFLVAQNPVLAGGQSALDAHGFPLLVPPEQRAGVSHC